MKIRFKRLLSTVLSAAVVLSSLVFAMPAQTASAADAGEYYVKVTVEVSGGNNLKGKYGGVGKEVNDSGGVSVLYRDTNGTGKTDNEYKWDMGNNGLKHCKTDGTKYLTATISGFPRLLYVSVDDDWIGSSITFKATKLEVGSSSSNLTTIWEGTVQAQSRVNPYAASVDWSYTTKVDYFGTDKNCKASTTTKKWTRPYASNMTASFNAGSVNCPKTSSASDVTNTLSYGATDQYGVTMASSLCDVSVASDQASNQVNSSNAVSITNNHTGTDTVSAKYAANLKGATNSQTITATCSWSGSEAMTKTATFTLYDAIYVPTFKYYTTNEAGTTGTENTVTGTSTYFGVVPTVPTAASAVTAYHTSTTHYTDGKYSNLPDSATGIRADSTYTMSYTSGAHNKVLVNTEPTDGVEGKNYYECDGCDIKFVCDAEGNPGDVASESDIAAATVPAPSFNTFSGVGYDYSARGVALRCLKADLAQQTSQATRFTASLQIPAGAQVDDFGYVYTQTRFLNGSVEPENDDNTAYGIENFTLDNVGTQYNIYQQSVMQNGTEGNGYTTHTSGANTVYTFNLLINVRNANWTKHYAARAYIKYTYNGRQYTVYDKSYSSRTVYYVAQKICDASNTSEKEQTKKSVNNKVLNFVNPDAYPLV